MKISENEWKVVEARLDGMPEDMTLGILSTVLTKSGLQQEVKGRTDIGMAYSSMQLKFIKWLLQESKIV